jgi:hypothetical protein
LVELPEGGVGQSYDGLHYDSRNLVCSQIINDFPERKLWTITDTI